MADTPTYEAPEGPLRDAERSKRLGKLAVQASPDTNVQRQIISTQERVKNDRSKVDSQISEGEAAVQKTGGYAPSYKRGGKVKKTGIAKLHKGERVLTVRQARKVGGKHANRPRGR